MIIANPLYDVVFKYLLEDAEIAGDAGDPLVQKMVERLGRAIASDEFRNQMDLEDEIDRVFQREIRKAVAEAEAQLAVERQRAEAQLAVERQRAEALQRELDELRKKLGE